MTITPQTIQELKQNITPVQVIEFYTGQIRSHGKYICPFHNDKHPSLSVKGEMWRCWSCGEKGDIIDFTRKYFSIGFQDAVTKLANDFGIAISRDPVQRKSSREQIMWSRIQQESKKENRTQLRNYLDSEIETLNTCYRLLYRSNASRQLLEQYEDDLDYLIEARSDLGEIDWKLRMTSWEVELHEELRKDASKVDPELVSLLTSSKKSK